ncbi:5068_t:CDS:2, partial [Gigaspora rosea]
ISVLSPNTAIFIPRIKLGYDNYEDPNVNQEHQEDPTVIEEQGPTEIEKQGLTTIEKQ